ncbi:hypothetical protein Pan110_51060 [Gimesia panareensis]|nr:hypothetical protein Pan110_51060 [Gimesia panareensis]
MSQEMFAFLMSFNTFIYIKRPYFCFCLRKQSKRPPARPGSTILGGDCLILCGILFHQWSRPPLTGIIKSLSNEYYWGAEDHFSKEESVCTTQN